MALTNEGGRWVDGNRRLTGSEILEHLVETAEKVGEAKVKNSSELGRLLSLEFGLKHEVLGHMDLPEMKSEVPY